MTKFFTRKYQNTKIDNIENKYMKIGLLLHVITCCVYALEFRKIHEEGIQQHSSKAIQNALEYNRTVTILSVSFVLSKFWAFTNQLLFGNFLFISAKKSSVFKNMDILKLFYRKELRILFILNQIFYYELLCGIMCIANINLYFYYNCNHHSCFLFEKLFRETKKEKKWKIANMSKMFNFLKSKKKLQPTSI